MANKRLIITGIVMSLMLQGGLNAAVKKRPDATLTRAVGLVEVKQDTQWRPADEGTFLYAGDKIRTSKNGVGEVLFRDGSLIRLTRNSYLTILPPEKKGKRIVNRLGFDTGDMWAKVVKGRQLEVESAVAVASVKGTEFSISMTKNTMSLFVYEGVVALKNAVGSIDVKADEKAKTTKSTRPKKKALKAREKRKLLKKNKIEQTHVLTAYVDRPTQAIGQVVPVTIKLINQKTNKTDKFTTKKVEVRSHSSGLKLSAKKSGFTSQIKLKVLNGVGQFYVRADQAGQFTVSGSSEGVAPFSVPIHIVNQADKHQKSADGSSDDSLNQQTKQRELKILKGRVKINDQQVPIEIILQER